MKCLYSNTNTFRCNTLATLLLALCLAGCGAGESDVNSLLNNASLLSNDDAELMSDVAVHVDLPPRITNLNEALLVQGTVNGTTSELNLVTQNEYKGNYQLPFNVEHLIQLFVRRRSDNLLLASAERTRLTSTSTLEVYFAENVFDMNIDSDGDTISNLQEIEDGSDPIGRNGDYDGDGTPDTLDGDDDNDGVDDTSDAFPYNPNESVDTDQDGTGNNADPDDDNDGVDDNRDMFPRDSTESVDTDGDGTGNNADPDDDNDGISDENDSNPLDPNSAFDTDEDGISNSLDPDDDNDGVIDRDDAFPLDDSETLDTDNDGVGNNKDDDDDNDVTHDLADPAPLNANITGREDSDSDGVPDIEDHFPLDPFEFNDMDGDGTGDNADTDNDDNGIPDYQEDALAVIPRTNRPPTLDGVFQWDEWQQAQRCDNKGNILSVGRVLRDVVGDEIESRWDWDNSNWRAMHDGTYLYILVSVRNEPFYERFNDSNDAWHDDGVEIYIDSGNEKATSYDSNDFQKVYTFTGNSATGSSSSGRMRTTFATSRNFSNSDATWSYYEIRIDMNSVSLPIGQRFGFDVHINDDDDGGDRDTKWGWYAPSGNDTSWQNPSLFGQAILAPDVGYYD